MSLVKDLALDPEVQAGIDRVRMFAGQRENWYRPGARSGWGALQGDPKRPGNRPEHVLVLEKHGGIKCAFSWTVIPEGVVRDLAVSMPGRPLFPSTVFALAEMFGFTERRNRQLAGMPHPGWQVEFDECMPPCLTVIEMTGATP